MSVETCRVYWGNSGCDLPRGHDDDGLEIRVHCQLGPSGQAVTIQDAYLFGEDLTDVERRARLESWGC